MHRLKLFGGIGIQADAGPVTGRAVQRRRLALLALLASARGGVSRDKLIALLWPEASAENGRRFLSDSVYRISQALGDPVITVAGDDLHLDAERLPSDLAEFRKAVAESDHATGVELYSGPFMDGFFLPDSHELERWIEREREALASEYRRCLEALARAAEGAGDDAGAVSWWRRLAAHDPYSARIAIHLMQALAVAGERTAAIRHAEIYAALLRQELDLEPEPEVRALAETLRLGPVRETRFEAPAVSDAPLAPADESSRSSADQAATDSLPAAVEGLPRERATAAPGSSSFGGSARISRRQFVLVAVPLIALVLVGMVPWLWRGRAGGSLATSPVRSVAVLPFTDLGPEASDQYFGEGLAEELISTLGGIDGLRVASRSSSFRFGAGKGELREIGRELQVEAVIDGSVRRSAGRWRITVQAVRVATGHLLWSETYERDFADVLDVQAEIARAVALALGGPSRSAVTAAAAAGPPDVDPQAYDLYLRGRYAWHRRTVEGLRQAITHLEEAVARVPGYARAYAGLADAYAVSAFYDYLPPRQAYPKAEAAARRAIQLDPSSAQPHATLAYVHTYYQMDWPRAEEGFRRAIAIDPDYSTAHQWYGNLLTVSGRFDEAEREMRLAQQTDPLSLIAHAALCWTLYHAARYDEAVEQCRATLALDSGFQLAHLWGGWALQAAGRRDEAGEWIERAVELSGGSRLTRLALAHLLAGSPSDAARDSAIAILREAESAAARGEYVPSYEIGKVHLALGERSAALEWLARARQERSHSRAFFRVDPQLSPLRGDPLFERLTRVAGN